MAGIVAVRKTIDGTVQARLVTNPICRNPFIDALL
jgi:hypothetical protein